MKRLPVLLAALTVVVAACGGGGDSSAEVASLEGGSEISEGTTDSSQQNADAADPEAAMLALTQCLREKGVDIADPTVDADGNVQLGQPDLEEGEAGAGRGGGVFREAFEACADLAEGVTLGFGQVDQTELEDTMLEFAACMRDNGVDMPDPDFSELGPGSGDGDDADGGEPGRGGPFGDLDFDDPVFQAAQETCGDILAGFGPGGGRFGGGPAGGGDDG